MVHDYDGLIYVIEVSGETIEVTDNHPFWVVDGTDISLRPEADHIYDYERGSAASGRWVDSEDLRPGDRLRLFDGQTAPISSITTYPAKIKVYNLAVAEYHNYAVTASGVLVHNRLHSPAEAGISLSDATRIQNAANRTNQRITVVGGRANPAKKGTGDWDYLMSGNSRARHSAGSSVPRGTSGGAMDSRGYETGIDIFTDYKNSPYFQPLDTSKPHVIFNPE